MVFILNRKDGASEELVYGCVAHELGHMFHKHCISESNPWHMENQMLINQMELELEQLSKGGIPLYIQELLDYKNANDEGRVFEAKKVSYFSSVEEYIARTFETLTYKYIDENNTNIVIDEKYSASILTDKELDICTHYIGQLKFATDS